LPIICKAFFGHVIEQSVSDNDTKQQKVDFLNHCRSKVIDLIPHYIVDSLKNAEQLIKDGEAKVKVEQVVPSEENNKEIKSGESQ